MLDRDVIGDGDDSDPVDRALSTIATSLIRRARNQDQESWRLLVEFHAPIVYGICRLRGLDPETACDVGQEVFTAISKNLDHFRPEGHSGTFRAWVRTIAENKIRDYWRKKNRQAPVTGGSEALEILREMPDLDESTLSAVHMRRELLTRIMNYAKNHFQPLHWQVFWDVSVDGQSAADVAAARGIDRAHVYVIKSRVLRQLRRMFADSDRRAE